MRPAALKAQEDVARIAGAVCLDGCPPPTFQRIVADQGVHSIAQVRVGIVNAAVDDAHGNVFSAGRQHGPGGIGLHCSRAPLFGPGRVVALHDGKRSHSIVWLSIRNFCKGQVSANKVPPLASC